MKRTIILIIVAILGTSVVIFGIPDPVSRLFLAFGLGGAGSDGTADGKGIQDFKWTADSLPGHDYESDWRAYLIRKEGNLTR